MRSSSNRCRKIKAWITNSLNNLWVVSNSQVFRTKYLFYKTIFFYLFFKISATLPLVFLLPKNPQNLLNIYLIQHNQMKPRSICFTTTLHQTLVTKSNRSLHLTVNNRKTHSYIDCKQKRINPTSIPKITSNHRSPITKAPPPKHPSEKLNTTNFHHQ